MLKLWVDLREEGIHHALPHIKVNWLSSSLVCSGPIQYWQRKAWTAITEQVTHIVAFAYERVLHTKARLPEAFVHTVIISTFCEEKSNERKIS